MPQDRSWSGAGYVRTRGASHGTGPYSASPYQHRYKDSLESNTSYHSR